MSTRVVTRESRTALARARLFLEKARACSSDARIDFEAFLEATIVFARSAIHRFQAQHPRHPAWGPWWDSLRGHAAVDFFRRHRDCILKEASPKVGQKAFVASIGGGGAYQPVLASEFYHFESPNVSATDTVARHLAELEELLREAETRFTKPIDAV
jgi:hypothetical protein